MHISQSTFLTLKIHNNCYDYQTGMKLAGIVELLSFYQSSKFQIPTFILFFFLNLCMCKIRCVNCKRFLKSPHILSIADVLDTLILPGMFLGLHRHVNIHNLVIGTSKNIGNVMAILDICNNFEGETVSREAIHSLTTLSIKKIQRALLHI